MTKNGPLLATQNPLLHLWIHSSVVHSKAEGTCRAKHLCNGAPHVSRNAQLRTAWWPIIAVLNSWSLPYAAYSAPKMNQICYLWANFPLNDRVKFQPVWSSSAVYKELASKISQF